MFYLVSNNEVVGISDVSEGLPNGFTAVESDLSLSEDLVYYDGKNILAKPPKPSDNFTWINNKWTELSPSPNNIVVPDVTQNPLGVTAFDYLKTKDETLANIVAYLLARVEGDTAQMQIRIGELQRLLKPKT